MIKWSSLGQLRNNYYKTLKRPPKGSVVYSGQATILIKKTSTPSITSIETDVVVANTNTKPFFHVRFHFEIPTNVEELGVERELHGVNPTTHIR
jgi:hypothetical protein